MSGQFKQPFPNPKKKPENASYPPSIVEQDTVRQPAASGPGMSNMPPQGGYVQGRHSQYGGLPNAGPQSGQAFPGAGNARQSGPGYPGMNGPFAVPQTPRPPFQQAGGPGSFAGPMGMPGMGNVQTPNPAWSGPRGPQGRLPKKNTIPSAGKRGKKKRRVPIWARVVIGFLTVLLVFGGASWWYYQANFASAVGSITGKNFARPKGVEDPNAGKTGSVLNWGRVNILLLGSDTDEKGNWAGNRYLAQTVIVVTIDTTTHDVGILSIPRDFWIPIPGYAYHDKLDTAFAYGGSINNNMSGVGEVVLTLSQDFGIPINFYAWVGLAGFTKVIDTVGGVDVDVMHPIVDDTYPDDVNNKSGDKFAYKRLYIPDGPQHLDGATALSYVRSRHSTTDFNRSARQQEVLGALKLKLENPAVIGELPQIAKDLQGYVYTQLSSSQVFDLMRFARGIDTSKIRHLTLGPPYSHGGMVGSSDVVFPNCNLLVPAVNQFLNITTSKCNIGNIGQGNSQMASAQPQPALVSNAAPSNHLLSSSQLADAGLPVSLGTPDDLFGLRDLLDLMSLVALDSPQL